MEEEISESITHYTSIILKRYMDLEEKYLDAIDELNKYKLQKSEIGKYVFKDTYKDISRYISYFKSEILNKISSYSLSELIDE